MVACAADPRVLAPISSACALPPDHLHSSFRVTIPHRRHRVHLPCADISYDSVFRHPSPHLLAKSGGEVAQDIGGVAGGHRHVPQRRPAALAREGL